MAPRARGSGGRRGGGRRNTKKKEPSTLCEALAFALDADSVQDEDIELARAEAVSDEKFVLLNSLLIKWGMHAGQPYKDAIQKLLQGQVTNGEVRDNIVKYIQYKLTAVRAYLLELLSVDNWNREVAGGIAELIKKELLEHLEVEVLEVKEIFKIAEEVREESSERLQLVRGEFLKNRVRSWGINTLYLGLTLEKWVKDPKPSFSSCDELYNASYDRPNF